MSEHQPISPHYQRLGMDVCALSEKIMLTPYQFNVLKYVLRAPYKGGEEDYRKAEDYLKRAIDSKGWERVHLLGIKIYTKPSERAEVIRTFREANGMREQDKLWSVCLHTIVGEYETALEVLRTMDGRE